MVLPTKGDYLDLIREGRKRTTIRVWDTCLVKPGARVTFTNYRVSVRARCTSVECVLVRTLTREDALADGFESRRALIDALQTHYPTLTSETRVWVVHFELLNDSAQSARATTGSG